MSGASAPSGMVGITVFGRYQVLKRLARGGMGEVYLARHIGGVPGADRYAIIKTILPERVDEGNSLEQFFDEARVAAKLNHPNIVQMYEAGTWGGSSYIVMEYIRGETLSGIIRACREGAWIPMDVAIHIVRDALLGLEHAHGALDELTMSPLAVVHRDVSPQNIMVRLDGVTKVVDFGIAAAAHKVEHTRTGEIKGKLAFMSPEQVMGEPLDGRSDQFSMGAVLWELLVGRRLFRGENDIQILLSLTAGPIAHPSSACPEIPCELDLIVMKMLSRQRDDRYPSCGEAANALGRWLSTTSPTFNGSAVGGFVTRCCGERIDAITRVDLVPLVERVLAARQGSSEATVAEVRAMPPMPPMPPQPVVLARSAPRGPVPRRTPQTTRASGSPRLAIAGLMAMAIAAAAFLFLAIKPRLYPARVAPTFTSEQLSPAPLTLPVGALMSPPVGAPLEEGSPGGVEQEVTPRPRDASSPGAPAFPMAERMRARMRAAKTAPCTNARQAPCAE